MSVVQNSGLRGERGTARAPGYLLIEGKIAEDGSAKLSATGIVASKEYARGVFAHKGEEYNYNIKAKFQDKEGTGARDTGLGVIGRPCTLDFAKQYAANRTAGRRAARRSSRVDNPPQDVILPHKKGTCSRGRRPTLTGSPIGDPGSARNRDRWNAGRRRPRWSARPVAHR